ANESVSQYAADICSLLHKIDPDNTYPTQYRIREFTKGLNSQYVFFINLYQSEIFEKAISIAIETETGFKTTYNNLFTLTTSTISYNYELSMQSNTLTTNNTNINTT
ncbi:3377_t:CDS:1, partial [Ambispora gerdemannii]